MDWIHLAKVFVIAIAVILAAAGLVVAAMVWLLNHPKD